MDFNVNPMTVVVGYRAGRELHIVAAIEVETSNTADVAALLRQRFPGHRIVVCPDPAGRARHTSVDLDTTDFTILERAGFAVDAPSKAPYWTDRVNATQALLLSGAGQRRCFVHPSCRALIRALSGYSYKRDKDGRCTSLPDKSGGLDHITDALGYLIWQQFNDLLPQWNVTSSYRAAR
jgi:hypothetical protein